MLTSPLPDGRVPVLLSAHDEDLIRQDARAILDYLDRTGADTDTAAVASTLLRLRRVRRHRAVVRAADTAELTSGLSALARGDEHPLVTHSSHGVTPCIAFVFPGQGNQWQSMGTEAYRRLPAYHAEADRCVQAFLAAGLPSPLQYLTGELDQNWSRTQIQGAQFTHAVSLAHEWRFHGVLPAIAIGHSLGEVAAAYVAGTISLADAVALVAARATIIDQLTGHYAMAVLGAGVDEAETLIGETAGWLEVSAVNGPSATVVSGDRDAVAAAVRLARQRGMFTHQLSVDYPGHTSVLRPLRTQYAERVPRSAFQDSPVRFVGSTFGAEVGSGTDFSQYWYENLCNTVRFDRAVAAARRLGANTFVELSAHPSLLYPLADLVDEQTTAVVGSGHREQAITDMLAANIATVATADPGCQWAAAIPGGVGPSLRGFPNAPMRAVHLWAAPEPLIETVPAPALTVAVEDWQQTTTSRAAGADIGIFATAPAGGALTQLLIDAVEAHGTCRVVPPNDAEIIAVIAPALDEADPAAAIEQIAVRPDAGLPDYTALIGPRCRAVWLLTAGAETIDPEDSASPAQAALAAMHRSVGFEFADQTFGQLDLSGWGIDARTAPAVVDVLLGEAAEVALRGSESPRRYVKTFRGCRDSATKRPPDAAALDEVVITGGSGAIGLQYARYCIERGARRLTLLSRNGIDRDTLRRLTEDHDTEVHAPRCDITDPAALAAVAARHAGASLLIHTAGIAEARSRSELTGPDVARVCAAKVRGLALLAEVWPLRPECRILACSSVFGVWGGYGHAAYAASNRMLDVLVAQLRRSGRDSAAIRWGLWQAAGVVAADEIARTERSGLIAMVPELAIEAGWHRYDGDPLIFDADLERLKVFFESQGMAMPFSEPQGRDATADDSAARPLAEVVHAELAATLHLDDSVSIDRSAPLIDLGVDSLLALDLRKRLRRTIGRSVPVARMLGGISLDELIDALRAGSTNGPRPDATPNAREARKVGLPA